MHLLYQIVEPSTKSQISVKSKFVYILSKQTFRPLH